MKKIWIMRIIFSLIYIYIYIYIFNGVKITKKSIQSRVKLKKSRAINYEFFD